MIVRPSADDICSARRSADEMGARAPTVVLRDGNRGPEMKNRYSGTHDRIAVSRRPKFGRSSPEDRRKLRPPKSSIKDRRPVWPVDCDVRLTLNANARDSAWDRGPVIPPPPRGRRRRRSG